MVRETIMHLRAENRGETLTANKNRPEGRCFAVAQQPQQALKQGACAVLAPGCHQADAKAMPALSSRLAEA